MMADMGSGALAESICVAGNQVKTVVCLLLRDMKTDVTFLNDYNAMIISNFLLL